MNMDRRSYTRVHRSLGRKFWAHSRGRTRAQRIVQASLDGGPFNV